jgi:hypothetical protein
VDFEWSRDAVVMKKMGNLSFLAPKIVHNAARRVHTFEK